MVTCAKDMGVGLDRLLNEQGFFGKAKSAAPWLAPHWVVHNPPPYFECGQFKPKIQVRYLVETGELLQQSTYGPFYLLREEPR